MLHDVAGLPARHAPGQRLVPKPPQRRQQLTAVEAFLRPWTGRGPDPAKRVRMVPYLGRVTDPYPAHPACFLYFFGTCQAVWRMST